MRADKVLDEYFEAIGWALLATSGLGDSDGLADTVMHTDNQMQTWFGEASPPCRADASTQCLAEQKSDRPPDWMAKAAAKGIEEAKENGAGTRVGRVRASQLKARKPLSRSVLKRLIAFLSRHKGQLNRNQNQERRRTAMALWGGGSKSSAERAISWARGQLRKMEP